MKRLFYTFLGLGCGLAAGVALVRWAGRTKEKLAPTSVAGRLSGAAAALGDRVKEGLTEYREAMREREEELNAQFLPDADEIPRH
ncbi:MAG: hypothetical protein WDA71_00945 [Actinomycetota bacterium]